MNPSQPAFDLVRKYGSINLVWMYARASRPEEAFTDSIAWKLARGGPQGHLSNPWERTVFIDPEVLEVTGPEVLFHEVAHIILHPPMLESMDDICEAWILMQAERVWAKILGSTETMKEVISWQEDTMVYIDGERELLCDHMNYETSKEWLDGFRLLQVLGVLDEDSKPTWKWPDWSRLSKEDRPWDSEQWDKWSVWSTTSGETP